jgi:thioredoxin-like negative regulator of GroEL
MASRVANSPRRESGPARFGVQSIPTLLLLKAGRELDRIVGVQSKAAIVQRIERVAA